MKRFPLLLVTLVLSSSLTSAKEFDIAKVRFPSEWKFQYTREFTEGDVERFGQSQGAKVRRIANHFYDAGGMQLQINTIECAGKANTARVFNNITGGDSTKLNYACIGETIFEFRCEWDRVVGIARHLMGCPLTTRVEYEVSFQAVPLERYDYMKWNIFFNCLLDLKKSPEDEGCLERARKCAKNFTFGDGITLRTRGQGEDPPQYSFVPEPRDTSAYADYTNYSFAGLDTRGAFPTVDVKARIAVHPYSFMSSNEVDVDGLVAETAHWPIKHRKVKAILKKVLDEEADAQARIEALQAWVRKNIEFGGKIKGSRYGTLKVIEQGFGHCWDQSDVLITLLRAAKVPARQVFGWIHKSSGHVWVEAYIPERGWIQVDPGLTWLGVFEGYIPFVISESGELDFVYHAFPEIKVIPAK